MTSGVRKLSFEDVLCDAGRWTQVMIWVRGSLTLLSRLPRLPGKDAPPEQSGHHPLHALSQPKPKSQPEPHGAT